MYSKCAICNLNVTVCHREYIKHKPMAKVEENSNFFFFVCCLAVVVVVFS